jgi:hypothetical protein
MSASEPRYVGSEYNLPARLHKVGGYGPATGTFGHIAKCGVKLKWPKFFRSIPKRDYHKCPRCFDG